jgi:hypothetical protein
LSELIKRLKLTLKLPEVGVVHLTITIKKSGEIAHFEVEKGSKGNSDYLKATLPQIKLPPFGHHFEGSSEHTFSFSLSSEL